MLTILFMLHCIMLTVLFMLLSISTH